MIFLVKRRVKRITIQTIHGSLTPQTAPLLFCINNPFILSVLPYNGGTYTQAPFEDIDEAKYNEMSKVLSNVDLTKVVELDDNTDLSGELACAGGNCEVV